MHNLMIEKTPIHAPTLPFVPHVGVLNTWHCFVIQNVRFHQTLA